MLCRAILNRKFGEMQRKSRIIQSFHFFYLTNNMQTSPPSQTPISVAGPAGAKLLKESESTGHDRWTNRMKKYLKRQRGNTYCGIASILSVVSYLVDADLTKKEFEEEKIFSMLQSEDVEELKNRIERQGLTLAELDAIVRCMTVPYPVKSITTERYHASSMTEESMRKLIMDSLATPNTGLVLNFDGAKLPNYKVDVGHHSPIVAYHAANDLVLVADVWPMCPVAWYTVSELWHAVNTIDSDSQQHRGLLKIIVDK